jgi:hypothetical protein
MLLGTGYRTSEEALRQLARLATIVGPGRGSRLMLQTSHPDSDLISTMRRGDPIPYLERILVERAREGSPPASEMIILEIRGEPPKSLSEDLADLDGEVHVIGPRPVDEGTRWLLTGDLGRHDFSFGRWSAAGATREPRFGSMSIRSTFDSAGVPWRQPVIVRPA